MTSKPRNAKADATCTELNEAKWPDTCGRPIKRGGYCGIHANMHGIPKDTPER